jgi:hypothetical protein
MRLCELRPRVQRGIKPIRESAFPVGLMRFHTGALALLRERQPGSMRQLVGQQPVVLFFTTAATPTSRRLYQQDVVINYT